MRRLWIIIATRIMGTRAIVTMNDQVKAYLQANHAERLELFEEIINSTEG